MARKHNDEFKREAVRIATAAFFTRLSGLIRPRIAPDEFASANTALSTPPFMKRIANPPDDLGASPPEGL